MWQKLMKSGAVVANGTDAPVEDVDPDRELLRDRHAGRLKDGNVFYPDQRMTRLEALTLVHASTPRTPPSRRT